MDLDTALVGDVVDEILSGVEDDELSGYGEEIVGAARRRRAAMAPNAGGRPQLQANARMALGLGVTAIATLTSAIITTTPQVPFRLERLVSTSTGLQVTDIKVGTNSQFVGSGSIPIEVFARDAVGVSLRGDTAVPGVDIALALSNPTGGSLNAVGAYIGYAVTK